MIQISVFVLTFNSDIKKLRRTLLSIVKQKKIKFEIVVSDDGSAVNNFDLIKDYFSELDFNDYKLISSETNTGTCLNLYRALLQCEGEFVRGMSDGECLTSDTILYDTYCWCKDHMYDIVFGNAIYFDPNSSANNLRVYNRINAPNNTWHYIKNNKKAVREDYLVNSDFICGATVFLKRELILKYVKRIIKKVKYAEDNAYRLMLFDGQKIGYYDRNVIFYEYGSGISTSGNTVWAKRLSDDINATNKVMIEKDTNDRFQKKIQRYLCIQGKYKRRVAKVVLFPWAVLCVVLRIIKPVRTAVPTSEEMYFFEKMDKYSR